MMKISNWDSSKFLLDKEDDLEYLKTTCEHNDLDLIGFALNKIIMARSTQDDEIHRSGIHMYPLGADLGE